ncbi:Nicotinate-nucleotide adenylyltransferase [Rickettsiales endosymbiont of Paramecium tredecaurelia]|uniref:nicotinate-nicotinamide nucleotide adenylyltransferase n=1 Tax=Candidatus Sarmatiella mevalonica TaxID=2770581 RepID=UPI0019236116|nr:nicotinate-nicotinamide nucleotide adenylyltransferase [Candidatus Sarmatiella mevalonica]MBL3284537.1 Nicotinate-nucleotide adenylyltransferase [Candidatus Sarmatiella mevalonica]
MTSSIQALLLLNGVLDLSSCKKIAFFGGSFNPPHLAHYYIAQRAIETLDIDYVIFLIASQNQFKEKYIFDFEQRASMTESIIMRLNSNNELSSSKMLVSRLEQDILATNSAQVLSYIKSGIDSIIHDTSWQMPELYWLMGADNLRHFHLWENFSYIIENYNIALFNRPGHNLCHTNYSWLLKRDNVFTIQDTDFNISSSQIRAIFTKYLG